MYTSRTNCTVVINTKTTRGGGSSLYAAAAACTVRSTWLKGNLRHRLAHGSVSPWALNSLIQTEKLLAGPGLTDTDHYVSRVA